MKQIDIEINKQLARTMVQTKLKQKPILYERKEWDQFKLSNEILSQTPSSLKIEPCVLLSRSGRKGANPVADGYISRRDNRLDDIKKSYKALQPILDEFCGKVVLAGGAMLDQFTPKDVDLYFINCTEKEIEQIIKRCELIISESYGVPLDKIKCEKYSFLCNLSLCINNPDPNAFPMVLTLIYQFIKKSYNSIEDLLDSFDFSASQICYDGKKVVATESGAWAYANNLIILDISRLSTSYAHRIYKYGKKLFVVIIPGIKYINKDYYSTHSHKNGPVISKITDDLFLCNGSIRGPLENQKYYNGKTSLESYRHGNHSVPASIFYANTQVERLKCYPLLTPQVETILRLARQLDKDSYLYGIPKEILRLIITFIPYIVLDNSILLF